MNEVSEALRATCMKARIYTSAFGTTVTVRDASRKVEVDNNAVRGAARVVANRLAGADQHDKAVRAAQRFCVDALYSVSMPYAGEDGWRLLPTANFMPPAPLLSNLAYGKKMFDEAVAAYNADADRILELARRNLGDLDVTLPTKDELISAYTMRTAFEELPSGVIPGLPTVTQQKLARGVQRKLEEAAAEARDHTLRRFVKPLEHFVSAVTRYEEGLADPNREGRNAPRFHDSLVGNLKGLYDTLASFNVLGDADIAELGNQIASLAHTNPDDLRQTATVRTAAVGRANQILKNLDDWLSPPVAQAAE